jgi:hypothetical protein
MYNKVYAYSAYSFAFYAFLPAYSVYYFAYSAYFDLGSHLARPGRAAPAPWPSALDRLAVGWGSGASPIMMLQHQSNSVTHDRREPVGKALLPRGAAALVLPILHNPSFPSVNEIVASTLQQVLIPERLALGVPISSSNILQIFQHNSSLLDAREWQISEQVLIPEGI